VTYEYQFTLRPATDPIALTPVVTVETIHATVRSAAGGLLGFLVDIFVNEFVALLRAEGSFSSTVQALIQETIDVQFAGAISAQPVRPTSVTVETLTIDAGVGVSVNAWGAVSTRRMCAASASGGSVRLRGRDQLSLMRRLRDELLSGSPRGRAYIATYERHNRELARLLVRNSKLLKLADRVVVGVMTDFGDKPLRAGRLSQSTADVLIEAMAAVEKDASPELALAIRSLRPEVSDFVRHRASTVLGASWPHPIGKE